MRRIPYPAIALAVVTLCAAAPAGASGFIGANYGLTYFSGEGDFGVTTIALPGSPALFAPTSVPGLRLGTRDQGGNVFYTDFALMFLNGESSAVTAFHGSVNYQREFEPRAPKSVYLTVGVGLFHTAVSDVGTNNPSMGGGLGFRSEVAEGWGDFRFETRVDHYFEDAEAMASANAISFVLGFDLRFSKP